MRIIIILLLFMTSLMSAQNLKSYQWKNRIVLLFGKASSETFKKQQKLFKDEHSAIVERDMLIMNAEENLKSKLSLKPGFEGVVLIGKDGTVKFSEEFLVDPKILFSLIDSMPMRKVEMRRKKG
ncbi:DUF4174 domain-containing protein [Allomuricauda sp. d1]|uniref:DUF4174 domain-containing protein n=1 Tax=Allomuricauda sp. d1 TaxID=3136725 RepID=UPI0031D66DF2